MCLLIPGKQWCSLGLNCFLLTVPRPTPPLLRIRGLSEIRTQARKA